MLKREFKTETGKVFTVESDRKNIYFLSQENEEKIKMYFESEMQEEIKKYLLEISKGIWKDFEPKEANSMSSDYWEYYDKKYDNNGYLSVDSSGAMTIEKPSTLAPYFYKFNKRRMESFMFDLEKRWNK